MLTRTLRHLSVSRSRRRCCPGVSFFRQSSGPEHLHRGASWHGARRQRRRDPQRDDHYRGRLEGLLAHDDQRWAGELSASSFAAGHLRVDGDAPGFAKLTESNVVLTVGERAELRLSLAVGGSETVT